MLELGKYLVSNDVLFSECTPFFYGPPISTTTQGEKDDWLVYQVTRVVTEQSDDVLQSPSCPIEHQLTIGRTTSAPARPPIVQIYSRRREIDDTCSASIPLLSNIFSPDQMILISLLLFAKVKRLVNPHIPLLILYPMTTCNTSPFHKYVYFSLKTRNLKYLIFLNPNVKSDFEISFRG